MLLTPVVESESTTTFLGGNLKTSLLRTVLTALTCVAVSSVGLVSAPAALAEALPITTCANTTIFGVSGSEEQENIADAEHRKAKLLTDIDTKFGVVNAQASVALTDALPTGTTFRKVAVPYEPSKMRIASKDEDVITYRNSITASSNETVRVVEETLKRCPQTKLVIIGYGQGAQVAHEAANLLPSSVVSSLAGIWLISDPIQTVSDQNQYRYAGNGQPVPEPGPFIDPKSQAPGPEAEASRARVKKLAPTDATFGDAMKEKVINVCHAGDPWCSSIAGVNASNPTADYMKPEFTAKPAQRISAHITKMCTDVTFFAARGSGEEDTGENYGTLSNRHFVHNGSGAPVQFEEANATESDYKQGFGATLSSLAFAIESKSPRGDGARTFGHVSVDYTALSVAEATTYNSRYPESVHSGIEPTKGPEQFRELIRRCPATKVIMLGYSQGGHVIHEIMMQTTEEERSHISSAVLVADASRNPEDKGTSTFMGAYLRIETHESVIFDGIGLMRAVALIDSTCLAGRNLSKAADGKRILGFFFGLQGLSIPVRVAFCGYVPNDIRFSQVVSPEKFPNDVSQKILNVCAIDDLVCDAQVSINIVDSIVKDAEYKGLADEVHGKGYMKPNFYDFPAAWSYEKLTLTG